MQAYQPIGLDGNPHSEKRLVGHPARTQGKTKESLNQFLAKVKEPFDQGLCVTVRIGRHSKDCKTFEEARIFVMSRRHRHDAPRHRTP